MSRSLFSPASALSERAITGDGRALGALRSQASDAIGAPPLADDAGTPSAPRKIEPPRGSPPAAAGRGGYPIDRYPDPDEPWCNCDD